MFVFVLSLMAMVAMGQVRTFTLTVNSTPITGVAITATTDFNGLTGGNTDFTLTYALRTFATLTAPANVGGDLFANWQIDGVDQPAGQTTITQLMSNNHTVNAVYTIPNFTVTVQSQNPNSGVAITASPDNAGLTGGTTTFTLNYPNGSRTTLTAPANVGNNPFLHWNIGGVNGRAGANRLTVPVNGNFTAIAVYQPTNVLTVQSQNPNSGVAIGAAPADNTGATTGNTQFALIYNTGTSVTLTAPSTAGANNFQHWVLGGVAQPAGAVSLTTTLNADTTAVAVYAPPNFTLPVQSTNPASGVPITASPPDNAGLTGGTTAFNLNYPAGTVVTLTAPANVGNNPFLHWTVNGTNQPAGQRAVNVTVTSTSSANAVYQPTNVLTVASQNPASGVPIGAAPADNTGKTTANTQFALVYNTGTSVTLTAPATSGFNVFQNWLLAGMAQGAGVRTLTTTVGGDFTVTAVYTTPNFALTVQSQNPGSGVAVTAAPADNAGLTGGSTTLSLSYPAGANVTLTAPANVGTNPFLHWNLGGVNGPAGQTTLVVPVTSALTAIAVYQPTNTLTVQSQNPANGVAIGAAPADNTGKTTGNTQFALAYNTGTSVTLTAPPTSGFNVFQNWTLGGVAQPAGQLTLTTTLNADSTAVAIYRTPNFALSVQSQNPGSGVMVTAAPADNAGLVSGSTTFSLSYPAGTSVTLTAPANVGNDPFLHWTVNGVNQPAGQTTVTFTVAAADTAIAVFQSTNVLTVGSLNPATGLTIGTAPADNKGANSGVTRFNLIYNTGTSVTLTAPARSGFNVFQNWTVDGIAQPAGVLTVTTILNADSTAVAVYRTPNFGLTVQSQNPGSGVNVTAAPADNAGLTNGSTTVNLSYPAGTRVTLTTPANIGNNPFIHWTVNGVNQPAGQTSVSFLVSAADTAIAVYQATNVLTVQSADPASGVAIGAAPPDNNRAGGGTTQFTRVYDTGSVVTLTAPSTVGLHLFQNWTLNGVAQPAGVLTLKLTLTADTTVVAVYRTPNFGLSVQSQNPGSAVTVTSSPADNAGHTSGSTTFNLSYPAGDVVTLTAPARVGNNPFLHWTINGVNQPAGQTAVRITVTSADTAIAVYQPTNVLTVQSQNPASGVAISAAPADNTGATTGNTQFSLVYNTGAVVTLTAPALQVKQIFNNWVVNGVAQPVGQTQIKVTLSADTTVVAIYNTPIYVITTSVLGTHATMSPTPSASVLLGGSQTFSATPAAGYVVNTWVLDGVVAQAGGNTFQLTNLQSNHTLQVTIKVVLIFHPADINKDAKLVIGEITAYGAAWKHGATWPNAPNPIPQSFVTVAISLWKSGEVYTFDPSKTEPNSWIPLASAPFGVKNLTPSALGGATATESAIKQADGSYLMTIQINPSANNKAMTVEEYLTPQVQVLSVGERGILDPRLHVIRWGPFTDGAAHTITYVARFKGAISSSGVASFDGVNVAIKRDRSAGGK